MNYEEKGMKREKNCSKKEFAYLYAYVCMCIYMCVYTRICPSAISYARK